DVAIPVVAWDEGLYPQLGMTGTVANTDYGTASGTTVAVPSPARPMTRNLTGTQTIATSSITMSWAKPAPSATVAATQTTNPARAVLFGYETGTTMVGVTAPARRVGLPLNTTTTTRLNATGWKLIEGAVGWAVPEIRYQRDATDRIVGRSIGGTIVERYGYTGAGDSPDIVQDATGAVLERSFGLPGGVSLTKRTGQADTWAYPNLHGDIVATTDNTGTKTGTFAYDPYGNALSTTLPDTAHGNADYGWLGQHQKLTEHEPGLPTLVEMGARIYTPSLGRFLQTDPIEGGSSNDYDYTAGDPTNNHDLDGRRCLTGKNPNGSCRGSRYIPGTKESKKDGTFCYTGKNENGSCRGSSAVPNSKHAKKGNYCMFGGSSGKNCRGAGLAAPAYGIAWGVPAGMIGFALCGPGCALLASFAAEQYMGDRFAEARKRCGGLGGMLDWRRNQVGMDCGVRPW
ncbi:MAG: RHS repeat-associated core domain-containing protein, partial [Actinomycetota bacterium]